MIIYISRAACKLSTSARYRGVQTSLPRRFFANMGQDFYKSGRRLTINFTPENHPPGSPPHRISCAILRPFLPFTNSQVMQVQIQDKIDEPKLPDTFVLKIYDRRFMERVEGCEREWTPNVEQELRSSVTETTDGSRSSFNTRDERTPVTSWEETHELEGWMHEMKVWDRAKRFYTHELKAYRALHSLQGESVPRLLGSLECLLSENPDDQALPPVLYRPPGIALEYIEGNSVDHLKRSVNISCDDADHAAQAALQVARQLRKFGILHNDIRSGNILVREHDRQAFLIDFAHSEMHDDYPDWPLEKWEDHVAQNTEIEAMRVALAIPGFHLPTPRFAAIRDCWKGYSGYNKFIEDGDAEWRARYWMSLKLDGADSIMVQDNQGQEHRYEFQRWDLKPGIRESLYDR